MRYLYQLFLILFVCVFSQTALAKGGYQVISTNSSTYKKVKTLSANSKIYLRKGQYLKVKSPKGNIYLLRGPYSAKIAKKKGFKQTLLATIRAIGKLIRIKGKRGSGLTWKDGFLLEEPFCYDSQIPPILQRSKLQSAGKLMLYARNGKKIFQQNWPPQAQTLTLPQGVFTEGTTYLIEMGNILKKITLYQIPDDEEIQSGMLYKFMWMQEKGCNRQASLLLSEMK